MKLRERRISSKRKRDIITDKDSPLPLQDNKRARLSEYKFSPSNYTPKKSFQNDTPYTPGSIEFERDKKINEAADKIDDQILLHNPSLRRKLFGSNFKRGSKHYNEMLKINEEEGYIYYEGNLNGEEKYKDYENWIKESTLDNGDSVKIRASDTYKTPNNRELPLLEIGHKVSLAALYEYGAEHCLNHIKEKTPPTPRSSKRIKNIEEGLQSCLQYKTLKDAPSPIRRSIAKNPKLCALQEIKENRKLGSLTPAGQHRGSYRNATTRISKKKAPPHSKRRLSYMFSIKSESRIHQVAGLRV